MALERKEPMREERKREEGTTCGLQENFSREVTTEMVLEGWVSAIQVKNKDRALLGRRDSVYGRPEQESVSQEDARREECHMMGLAPVWRSQEVWILSDNEEPAED